MIKHKIILILNSTEHYNLQIKIQCLPEFVLNTESMTGFKC